MKITQEVREFARLQSPTPSPASGRGRLACGERGEGGREDSTLEQADQGMAQMSKRFHEEGGELYVPAAE